MKKWFLLAFLIASSFWAKGSHIVGGEFELKHVQGFQYRLNLILYFDKIKGDPGAKDESARASIFRMIDNNRMLTVVLPLTDSIDVFYTAPLCASPKLKTMKYIYTALINLPEQSFSHPDGYYVSWQRCCRNYTITNIFSEDPSPNNIPDPNAIYAGQTFYLEFPPVTKNGERFIDSTPELFPPLSDYGRVGSPYYVDFGGTDFDGDSLVYSLADPLNTVNSRAVPLGNLPLPKTQSLGAYPNIRWRPPYGSENVMNGNPDLFISADGLLTVTPADTGLFVFAVKCEEFRDGEKIGETRRDFQMRVLEAIDDVPPIVKGRKLGEPSFTYRDNMNITFTPGTTDNSRCIEIEVSDPDIFGSSGQEFVAIKPIIGFGPDRNQTKNEVILPVIKSATLSPNNQSVVFKICFDGCPLEKDVPYKIGIIVRDDACALPLLDTLQVSVTVLTPPNSPAQFTAPSSDVFQALFEGTSDTWPVKAFDPDGDTLKITMLTDGFNLPDYGMDFDFVKTSISQVNDTLIWNAKCDEYDFSLRQSFKITLLADDSDLCSYNIADTTHFYLNLINPSADPVIDTDLTPEFSERFAYGGTHKIYDADVGFNLFGYDTDPFPIELKAEGIDFDMDDYDMTFQPVSGLSPIQSPFLWRLSCTQFKLAERDTFAVRFIAIDRNNKCKIYQADTVEVGFKVLPPNNQKPVLDIINLNPETTDGLLSLTTFWDKPIALRLTGTDADRSPQADKVSIDLIDVETTSQLPEGYTFTPTLPATGISQAQTIFSWQPNCTIFSDNIFDNSYKFTFRVYDDHCESVLADTVGFVINIEDYISTDENFLPPSVITPNGDNTNDFFALDGYSPRPNGTDPDDEINLPLDNCLNEFESIRIYNRWGKLVFSSTNRFFRWYAPDAGAGVYYYLLKYTQEDYKGSLLVRY